MNSMQYITAAIKLPKIVNPLQGVETKIQVLNDKIDHVIYWSNPVHWAQETWSLTDTLFTSGNADIALLIGTIAAIWLIMLGANKPKKYLFWTWIGFWILRGVVFV